MAGHGPNPAPRPLDGVFVLDFSTLLPGPMATLMLAEAGAEVVKIERPGTGEDMRAYAPRWGRDSANFALLNRGKKSLALDLKNADDRARLAPLIARADVLVEQFRPGVMARLGLAYEDLAAVNPGLIYCSITGYGQTGPKASAAGHDLNYMGDSGLLALSPGPAGAPVVPPALVADVAGGAYPAVMNVLLALQARASTGRGAHIDVSMTENLFPFAFWALGAGFATGSWPGGGDALLTGGSPRYGLYPTADGRLLAAAPIEPKFWAAFCETLGLDESLRDDSRDPAATRAAVARIVAGKGSREWAERFARVDCCCTIVATLEEAIEDPHFRERGVFGRALSGEDGRAMPALPLPIDPQFRGLSGEPLGAPALGAHDADYD